MSVLERWFSDLRRVSVDVHEWDVGGIELVNKHGISWSISDGRSAGDITVVRSDSLVDRAPLQVDWSARV